MRNRIDTTKEKPLTLSELAYWINTKHHKELSTRTLRRWIEEGQRDGERTVYMDRIKIGGLLHSSLEAYDRFIQKLNEEGE